jgi:PAS domain S-box-containing protein
VAHPIFVKDRAHLWVWVNHAFAELVGVPPEALLGKTDRDYFPVVEADWFYAKDRQVFERGETVTTEEPITDVSGVTHMLATTKMPLRAASGEITHVVGIIHDITRLKQVEEELRVANEALERRVDERTRALQDAQDALLRRERLALLGQLSGGVAHQIRTPLATINNAVAVLRRNLGRSAEGEVAQALAIMSEEIWEANRIITDLLDFARARPPSLDAVTIASLIGRALEAVSPPPSVRVSVNIEPDLLAWADERQARDALGNVIRNALEAMPDGGDLTVGAAAVDGFACISITDTGSGVNDEVQIHLFEPLVTTKSLGLGLGLPTAKVLIENQGGDLRFVRSTGQGARFEVRIPLVPSDRVVDEDRGSRK